MTRRLPRLRLHLTPAAESAVRRGHPWVYAESVREQNRPAAPGEIAVLYDRRDRFLALGLFDPHSPLRVRVLHVGEPVTLDDTWWRDHLAAALHRRSGMFDHSTTGWRWIHGESDGWPGLVLDRYGDTCVLKIYTAAWLPWLERLTALLLEGVDPRPRSLILRLSRNIAASAARDGRNDGDVLAGEPIERPVVFLESGLRFEADVIRGQKTGFFLDQRENRRFAGTLATGGAVLNAFSFSGGFSLSAARGGARSVTDIDISPHALAAAQRNFALNAALLEGTGTRHDTIQADAFDWLARSDERRFDLVILDPPSLAKRATERTGALAAYTRLASLGASRLRSPGVLLAASCSAHVSAEEFFATVRLGVERAGRTFRALCTTAHPPDHPASFPEAHYLKALYLRIE